MLKPGNPSDCICIKLSQLQWEHQGVCAVFSPCARLCLPPLGLRVGVLTLVLSQPTVDLKTHARSSPSIVHTFPFVHVALTVTSQQLPWDSLLAMCESESLSGCPGCSVFRSLLPSPKDASIHQMIWTPGRLQALSQWPSHTEVNQTQLPSSRSLPRKGNNLEGLP